MDKICIRCKLSKPGVKFQTPGSKHCRKCSSDIYYIRNKEAIAKRSLDRYYDNLEENRKIQAKKRKVWRANNPDKVKIESKKKYDRVKADPVKYKKQLESVRKKKAEKIYTHLDQSYRDRSRDNLTDNYIKRTLLDHDGVIKYADIPKGLIDLKRKQLLLKRQIS